MNWFKKYFVAHTGNDHRPHIFREAGIGFLLSLILTLFIIAVSGSFIISRADLTALVLPKVLVDYANDDRSTKTLGQLAISPLLEKAAQLKANDMAEKGYFAHKSPEGQTPWFWFRQVGYDFSYAGENLAVNFNDSVEVNKAWMNSPGHRDNIMNSNFSEIGIATAEGMYEGRRTTFVVQLFGRPAKKTNVPTNNSVVTNTNKPSTSPVANTGVLSESVSSEVLAENGTNELFVAVAKESATTSENNEEYSSLVERAIMSPSKFLRSSYIFIAIIILMSLMSMIFIEIRKQHPRHILVAIGILIILAGLYYVYKDIFISPVTVA